MLNRVLLSLLSPAGARARLSVLIFHRVQVQPDPLFPMECDAARFRQIAAWLSRYCNVLPLDEALQLIDRGRLPARAAAITFDDGYADNYEVALPILQSCGLKATFFIATGFLDGGRMWNDTLIEAVRRTRAEVLGSDVAGVPAHAVVSVEEKRAALMALIRGIKHLPPALRSEAVNEVAEKSGAQLPGDLMLTSPQVLALRDAGMSIGAHTVSHPILASLDGTAARRELADSRDHLQGLLGERIALFAYPNGRLGRDYTREHVDLARELGFAASVTTNPGAVSAACDRHQLPRFTPWDRVRWRFGLRMARNLHEPVMFA